MKTINNNIEVDYKQGKLGGLLIVQELENVNIFARFQGIILII